LEEFPIGQDIHFLQGRKGELGRISKQVCGNGLGGLEGHNMGAPSGDSDEGLGRAEAMGRYLGSFAVLEGAHPEWRGGLRGPWAMSCEWGWLETDRF